MADGFTADERTELRKLLEIEKIRKAMQLYSQLMDARDIDAMMRIYTEDATGVWGPFGTAEGRDQIHAMLTAAYQGRLAYDGLHCTANLHIELTGPDRAISRAYLVDFYPGPDKAANPLVLLALYDNDWRREADGAWRIARSVIEFVWPDRLVSADFPRPMPISAVG